MRNRVNPASVSPTVLHTRRDALKVGLGGVAATLLASAAAAQTPAPTLAPTAVDPAKFSFDALSTAMRNRAASAYIQPSSDLPQAILDLDYDAYRRVLFRRDHALWANDAAGFQIQAFFPGFLYKDTAPLFVGDGAVFAPQVFTGADFEFLAPLDPTVFQSLQLPGVAGFRLNYPLERPDRFDEVISFLGASYFRALGQGNRYGLSARGLALNTATATAEEFPKFTAFYVVKPKPGDKALQLFAELDSPSVTGAFAFTVRPGPRTVVDVVQRLFFRNAVERLGVAPLTSMYYFGENDHDVREDFRPEVHDSDGLAVVRASGERLWRPLKNPADLALSYFEEVSPRSFGLLQRDRSFASYEDNEARYELRPSLVIEPMGDWGRGVIQLVEIPTNSEVNDNIVAFWVPETRPEAGSQFEFRYRMRWGDLEEPPDGLASVAGTLSGVGGNAADTSDNGYRRFAINFAGGTAANLPPDAVVDPIVDVPANARLVHSGISRLPDGGWRLAMELEKLDASPVELRAKLSVMQRIISETWLYQWVGEP